MIRIISDKPVPPWMEQMLQDMEAAADEPIEGYAIIARLEAGKSDADTMCRYYNLSQADRMLAAQHINYDLAYKAAQQAIENYFGTESE